MYMTLKKFYRNKMENNNENVEDSVEEDQVTFLCCKENDTIDSTRDFLQVLCRSLLEDAMNCEESI